MEAEVVVRLVTPKARRRYPPPPGTTSTGGFGIGWASRSPVALSAWKTLSPPHDDVVLSRLKHGFNGQRPDARELASNTYDAFAAAGIEVTLADLKLPTTIQVPELLKS